MTRKSTLVLAAALAIVAALLGAVIARALIGTSGPTQASLTHATLLEPPLALPQVTLIDDAGGPFTLERLQNGWHLLFFGFTNCPDVCPNTLTVLASVARSLDDLPPSQQPQVVLVSVDPARDTPEKLTAYVRFFSDRFIGVTGSEDAIAQFTRAVGIPVAKVPLEGGEYTVDHGGGILLIDPQGRLRALFSMPHDVATITGDYRRIVGG